MFSLSLCARDRKTGRIEREREDELREREGELRERGGGGWGERESCQRQDSTVASRASTVWPLCQSSRSYRVARLSSRRTNGHMVLTANTGTGCGTVTDSAGKRRVSVLQRPELSSVAVRACCPCRWCQNWLCNVSPRTSLDPLAARVQDG